MNFVSKNMIEMLLKFLGVTDGTIELAFYLRYLVEHPG